MCNIEYVISSPVVLAYKSELEQAMKNIQSKYEERISNCAYIKDKQQLKIMCMEELQPYCRELAELEAIHCKPVIVVPKPVLIL